MGENAHGICMSFSEKVSVFFGLEDEREWNVDHLYMYFLTQSDNAYILLLGQGSVENGDGT